MSTAPAGTAVQNAANTSETRFAFGKNWQRFLKVLNDERIMEAENSLRNMLQVQDLRGKSFLDIGSGSGLFSLAAMRLGAARVHSFDYDPNSVACTQELRRRYFQQAGNWTIEQGSALDANYLDRLGKFDVVYSWGVLHHTGNMWLALENAIRPVAPQGKLFIALYNHQDLYSSVWTAIKRRYSQSIFWRVPIIAVCGTFLSVRGLVKDVILLKNPLKRYTEYKKSRGMSYFTDLLDWLGGYPFEVAKPEAVFDFFRNCGFEMVKLHTVGGGLGCNEFVFVKRRESAS
ncbi:MAG TPA: class I SAM-dependent methyltransferase [Candidatus Angelobacter sp.]|jgi:2-polyprenyl-6-hydroxyphenyl methylase/3-demethylubiquinone-9 3-methyltransferase